MKAHQLLLTRARWPIGLVMAAAVLGSSQVNAAQLVTDDALVRDLLKKLEERDERIEERDAVIADLLKRVKQLEERLDENALDTMAAGQRQPGSGGLSSRAPAASTRQLVQAEGRPLEPPQTRATPEDARDKAPLAEPGTFVVEEEAAERALERTLVAEGALLLPYGSGEVEPSFTYVRNEIDSPGILLPDDDAFQVISNAVRQNEFIGAIGFRFGLPWSSQLEVGVPYRFQQTSFVQMVGSGSVNETSLDANGFGDVRVSLAKVLLREKGWRPDVIARLAWDSNTGEDERGFSLGSGFNELIGSLTFLKRQDPLAFVGSAFYETSFAKNAIDPSDQIGFGLGTVLAASPDTSLSLSLQQRFTDEFKINGRSVAGSEQVSSTLVLGASSILGRGLLFSLNVGIGLTKDAPDYFVTASLPIRFNVPLP